MTKLRLDNGIEYDAAPEVIQAYNKLKQDQAETVAAKDKAEARADSAEADLKKLQAEQDKFKQDALTVARERLELEAVAKAHNVEFKQDSADREIKIGVIKAIRGDSLNMDGKSDDYVAAAFDMAIVAHEEAAKAKAVAGQRQDMAEGKAEAGMSAAEARAKMIAGNQEGK